MTTPTPTADALIAGRPPTVRELRHRAEVPMLVLAGLLTIGGVSTAIAAALGGLSVPGWAQIALIGLMIPVFAGLVVIRFTYWTTISNAVEITPKQLPEIYGSYKKMADAMGMDDPPRLYLINGNGTLNAFASKCTVRKTYIGIYSDLVDIAYELDDFEGVKFVLAHELGHIHCGHVNLWRQGIIALPSFLKIGKSVTRAQEYTADRCAAYYAPEGAKAMMVLFAGKRMYQHVDIDEYFDSIETHNNGFWMKFANFWSDHAIGFRRMQQFRDLDATGWDVHGKML